MTRAEQAFNPSRVQQIAREAYAPRTSKLGQLTKELTSIAIAIEQRWDELDYELQNILRSMAKILNNPPRMRWRDVAKVLYVAIRATQRERVEYIDTVVRLKVAVNNVLKRERDAFAWASHDETLIAETNRAWEDETSFSFEQMVTKLERDETRTISPVDCR